MDNIGRVMILPIPQVQAVGIIYMSAAKICIPIYDHDLGDLKTAWKELLNAFKIGISEQAILFVYEGAINEITIPGIIHNRKPRVRQKLYRRTAKKYLLKFFSITWYGTFQVIISSFLKYKAGITIKETDNNADKTL